MQERDVDVEDDIEVEENMDVEGESGKLRLCMEPESDYVALYRRC